MMEQTQLEGFGSDIFAILRKKGVIGGEPEIQRDIITKVYEDTGEAVEWVTYDKRIHKKLRKGTEEAHDERGRKSTRPWKEMFISLPSRRTRNGFPIFFTDRDKKNESSMVLKSMRKLEAPEDNLAIRIVIDEKHEQGTKNQLFLLYQDMISAFEQEGYRVEISTGDGYMNTLSAPFFVTIGGKRVDFPAEVFNSKNNPAASAKRRVLQTDWKLVDASGIVTQFELQAMDTLGNINRSVNGEWSDDVYKVTQMYKHFRENEAANLATTFFPEYVYGFDANKFEGELRKYAMKHALETPNKNRLPD